LANIVDGLRHESATAQRHVAVLQTELADYDGIQRETELELMDATNDVLKLEECIDRLAVPGVRGIANAPDNGNGNGGGATVQAWAQDQAPLLTQNGGGSGVITSQGGVEMEMAPVYSTVDAFGANGAAMRDDHRLAVQQLKWQVQHAHSNLVRTQAHLKTIIADNTELVRAKDRDIREMNHL
jgi:hypothetical protein